MVVRAPRWGWVPVLLAWFGLAGCGSGSDDAGPPPRSVEVVTVQSRDLVDWVSVVGRLEAERQVRVNAEIPERIEKVHVVLGQPVEAGDPLVTLSGDLQAAGLGQATGALEAQRASAALAKAQLERVEVLYEAGTASRADLDTARRQYESAQAAVKQLSASRSQAALQTARSVVRAPFDGVVALLDARAGDMATPGRALAVVVEPGAARVVLDVPERDFGRLRVGQPARVWALSDPQRVVTGEVSAVGGLVDLLTRTGPAEIHLEEAAILPGSAVRAEIEVGRRADVVLVPALAVQLAADFSQSREGTAFVLADGRAEARRVTVGERDGDQVEITSGLAPGDVIVTLGAHLLKDDAPVVVVGGAT